MNCKQGDLALVVRGSAWGYIVTVIRPAVGGELFVSTCGTTTMLELSEKFAWVVEKNGGFIWKDDGGGALHYRQRVINDFNLRPIRDPGEDATDETLIYVGKPVRQGEPA